MKSRVKLQIKPGTTKIDRFFLTIAYCHLSFKVWLLMRKAVKKYKKTRVHQYIVMNGAKPFILSKTTFKWHRQHGTIQYEHTIDSIKAIALFHTHKV